MTINRETILSLLLTMSLYGVYVAWHYIQYVREEGRVWNVLLQHLRSCIVKVTLSPTLAGAKGLDTAREEFERIGFQTLGDFEIELSREHAQLKPKVEGISSPIAAPEVLKEVAFMRQVTRYRVFAHSEEKCNAYACATMYDPQDGKKPRYDYGFGIASRAGDWSYTITTYFEMVRWLEQPRALSSQIEMSWLKKTCPGEEFGTLAGYFTHYRDAITEAAHLDWEEPFSLSAFVEKALEEIEQMRGYAKRQNSLSTLLLMWRMRREIQPHWWGELADKLKDK